MKKLLLITDNFPFGKNEYTFIMPELPELSKRFEVVIASVNFNDPQTVELPENIKVLRINAHRSVYKPLGRIRALVDPAFYRECARVIASRNKVIKKLLWCHSYYSVGEGFAKDLRAELNKINWTPDIIYTYWHMTPLYGVLRRKKWFGNPKIVTRAHGRDIYNFRNPLDYQAFKKESDKLLDRIYLVGDAGVKYYLENFSVSDPLKCEVARLGSDNGLFVNRDKGTKIRLFSCSNVIKLKRINLIIDALAQCDSEIEWTHAGDGEQMEYIQTAAEQQLSNKANIKYNFLGRISNDAVKELLSADNFDFFITTSETEGLPVSIIEAFSYGLPAIATAVGGIPEIVNDSNGMLLSPNPSVEEISEAIKKAAATEKHEYEKLCRNAYDCWEKDFTAKGNAARFADKLLEICR